MAATSRIGVDNFAVPQLRQLILNVLRSLIRLSADSISYGENVLVNRESTVVPPCINVDEGDEKQPASTNLEGGHQGSGNDTAEHSWPDNDSTMSSEDPDSDARSITPTSDLVAALPTEDGGKTAGSVTIRAITKTNFRRKESRGLGGIMTTTNSTRAKSAGPPPTAQLLQQHGVLAVVEEDHVRLQGQPPLGGQPSPPSPRPIANAKVDDDQSLTPINLKTTAPENPLVENGKVECGTAVPPAQRNNGRAEESGQDDRLILERSHRNNKNDHKVMHGRKIDGEAFHVMMKRQSHLARRVVGGKTSQWDFDKKQVLICWDSNHRLEWINESQIETFANGKERGKRNRTTVLEANLALDQRLWDENAESERRVKLLKESKLWVPVAKELSDKLVRRYGAAPVNAVGPWIYLLQQMMAVTAKACKPILLLPFLKCTANIWAVHAQEIAEGAQSVITNSAQSLPHLVPTPAIAIKDMATAPSKSATTPSTPQRTTNRCQELTPTPSSSDNVASAIDDATTEPAATLLTRSPVTDEDTLVISDKNLVCINDIVGEANSAGELVQPETPFLYPPLGEAHCPEDTWNTESALNVEGGSMPQSTLLCLNATASNLLTIKPATEVADFVSTQQDPLVISDNGVGPRNAIVGGTSSEQKLVLPVTPVINRPLREKGDQEETRCDELVLENGGNFSPLSNIHPHIATASTMVTSTPSAQQDPLDILDNSLGPQNDIAGGTNSERKLVFPETPVINRPLREQGGIDETQCLQLALKDGGGSTASTLPIRSPVTEEDPLVISDNNSFPRCDIACDTNGGGKLVRPESPVFYQPLRELGKTEENQCIALHHMDAIFGSIDKTVSALLDAQAVPEPVGQIRIAGQLLGAFECYTEQEYKECVVSVLHELALPCEITLVYKQSLFVRFIHINDLCVIPRHWETQLQHDDQLFSSYYNLYETLQGTQHRFFQTTVLFKAISSLKRGKLSRQELKLLYEEGKKSPRGDLSDGHHPNAEISASWFVYNRRWSLAHMWLRHHDFGIS